MGILAQLQRQLLNSICNVQTEACSGSSACSVNMLLFSGLRLSPLKLALC